MEEINFYETQTAAQRTRILECSSQEACRHDLKAAVWPTLANLRYKVNTCFEQKISCSARQRQRVLFFVVNYVFSVKV